MDRENKREKFREEEWQAGEIRGRGKRGRVRDRQCVRERGGARDGEHG